MPINIYRKDGKPPNRSIAKLDWKSWHLATQLETLEQWLKETTDLPPGPIVADLGFNLRKGATGGGGVVSRGMMQAMLDHGIELHLSEYDIED